VLLPIGVVVVSALLAGLLWPEGFTSSRPPDADGGLILLADTDEQRTDLVRRAPVTASVSAEMWQTGFAGISMLSLSLTFTKPRPGLRWYVVASGQYNPRPDTDLNAFCVGLGATRSGRTVRCPDSLSNGSVEVEYRFGDQIGETFENAIHRINSLDGYIDGDATVITGRLAPLDYGIAFPTKIFIPIPTPKRARLGSDDYGSLAQITTSDRGDIGFTNTLRRLPDEYAATAADKAIVSTGHPVDYIQVPALHLELDEPLSTRTVAWASPPPDRADRLVWTSDQGSLGPISFLLHDPFQQQGLVRRSFLAGMFVSIGAGMVVVVIDQGLARVGRRRRQARRHA